MTQDTKKPSNVFRIQARCLAFFILILSLIASFYLGKVAFKSTDNRFLIMLQLQYYLYTWQFLSHINKNYHFENVCVAKLSIKRFPYSPFKFT